MALPNAFYPHAIQLPTPEITHLSTVSPSYNYEVLEQFSSGDTAPCFASVIQSAPDITATTTQIKSILDTCTEEDLSADLSSGNVDLFYRQGTPFAMRTAPATEQHIRGRLTSNALLYWSRMTARQGQYAEIEFVLRPASSTPLIWLDNQALAGTSVCNAVYTLSDVTLNSTAVQGVEEVIWDNQVELEEIPSDGEISPGYIAIKQYRPMVTIRTKDATQLAAATYGGDAGTQLSVGLRKAASTGGLVATGSAEHIVITATTGHRVIDGYSGSPADTDIVYRVLQPAGAGVPFATDTSSALS